MSKETRLLRINSRSGRIRVLLAGLVATALCGLPAFAAPGGDAALNVGVLYTAPPHTPGASPRSPEGVEHAVLERLAARRELSIEPVGVALDEPAALLAGGKVNLALVALPKRQGEAGANVRTIPLGYTFGAMAIMRSDTDITSWDQLKGRTVCVAEGGWFAGQVARQYGAVELAYKAPADSLIALRVGECDAAVHDSRLLEEIIKFPEWKKFSARLPVMDERRLVFVAPADDREAVSAAREAARQWKAAEFQKLLKKVAHNVAFEVYLDQEVPDCH